MRSTLAVLVAALALLAGCTAATGPTESPAPLAGDGDPVNLRGDCPTTVVIQTNWWPQAEYGALYRLLGPNRRPDKARKAVAAPLVSDGKDTGVELEIRSGGPAIAFTPAATTLYLDSSVLLAGVDLDQVARLSGEKPVRAVFAPMDASPVVLMWDPQTHPEFHSVADVGRSDARVLYFQGSVYMDYLTGAGVLKKSQVESSYDGTPARFVADGGQTVQQAYVTNEVFQYERELPQWRKPVGYGFVKDTGYPNYPEVFAVRTDREAELAPCLRKLVPILQRGAADYLADPGPTNRIVSDLVDEFDGFPYSVQRADHAAKVMRENGIMGNGNDAAVGDLDPAKAGRLLDLVRPIFAAQGTPVPDGTGVEQLLTNAYIDPSIGVR
ncbi:hypothetical protein [Actinosynnema sp. NPDC020468]|uniref:hypothetical protein n=1 Tax=Actinosynnema sp. NPDC020468 TaxID=3154488 RepID=UPI0033CF386D